ncbi:MAG: vWA domain-containing protein [Methermicoccaceae archaeon]
MDEKTEKRIRKIRSQMILKKPFWGYCATYMELREGSTPTMGVDGKYLYYNPERVESLDDEELMWTIMHEVYHLAFGHVWRRGARDPDRWNFAADCVGNAHLKSEGLRQPEGTIFYEFPADARVITEAKGMSVEEVYSKIPPPMGGSGGAGGGGKMTMSSGDEVSGNLADDHDTWDKSGEDDETGLSKSQAAQKLREQWREYVSRARQVAKMQGFGMGSLEQDLDEMLNPKLPWQEWLRNCILSSAITDYRLVPANKKHLWRGLYLPSTYGESIEIAVAIDTSGSMSDEEVKYGMSEVRSVCEMFSDYRIHYFQCDYGVQLYEELTPYKELPRKIRGRGGTSFVPVFDAIQEKALNVSILVYFTDMMGTFPESAPMYPVLWVTTSGRHDAPFGQVISYER